MILPLIVVLAGLGGAQAVVLWKVVKRYEDHRPTYAPTPPPEHYAQFMSKVLETMAGICKDVIAPVPTYTQDDHRPSAQGAPTLEVLSDDPSDPMEAFLGAGFFRDTSGMFDDSDESPFGVPGLKAEL